MIGRCFSFSFQNPMDMYSVAESLLIRFRSDDSVRSKGFSVAYVATEPTDSEEVFDSSVLSNEYY